MSGFVSIEEFAFSHGVTGAAIASFVKFVERLTPSVKRNEKGQLICDSVRLQQILEQWKTHPLGERQFLLETAWNEYASSLIKESIVSARNYLAFGYYMGGAAVIESFVNIDQKPLPMVLIVDEAESVLKLQSADFVENPAEYPIRMTLPLKDIIWAVIKPVPIHRDYSGTAKVGVSFDDENMTSKSAELCMVVTYKQTGGVGELVFKSASVDDKKIPEQPFFDFAHTLQTFSPFYSVEGGQEYFDVEL